MPFRLQHFDYNENSLPLIGDDINTYGDGNIYTIIIGKNGSGKSRALSTITNILCSLYVDNKLLKRTIGFESKFSYGESSINLSVIKNGAQKRINLRGRSIFAGNHSNSLINDFCPEKIIAVSTSPFDKFPEEEEYFSSYQGKAANFYSYYGVGNSPKNRVVKSLIEKILFTLINNPHLHNNKAIINAMDFLGFMPKFSMSLRLRHSIDKFIKNIGELDEEKFLDFLSGSIKKDIRYSGKKKYVSYSNLTEAFYKLQDYYNLKDNNQRNLSFSFSFDDNVSIIQDAEFLQQIRILVDVGILNLIDITIYNKDGYIGKDLFGEEIDSEINIDDISSGQKCLLLNVLSIATSITDNSLILIDEPEISLHPEWQETYIQLLTKSFESYKGCHFIIATHSPQIISNLPKNNCFVSNMETEEIITSSDQSNKSADFQLATIFNAPGNDNEYLKRIAINILTLISINKLDPEEYMQEISLLKQNKMKLDKTDSVRMLIELIETYEAMSHD